MATIALDATYTVDPQPSGMAVYSRRLIESLATLDTAHRFLVCYRLSRFGRRREFLRPGVAPGSRGPAFSLRYFQEPLTFWLPWQVELFHSLAQRPPAFRFRKEIVTVNDVFPITGKDYSTPEFQRKFSALLLEAVKRAARVIAPSQYTAEQLVRHAGVAREKLRVIPDGVDLPARFMTLQQRAGERQSLVGKDNEMLLSVGVLQTRKNTLNALRALASLPPRYRLVLAGGEGYGSEAIHDFIRQEALTSRVAVLGYVPPERLSALYQAASALLFPSLEEGFGLPVLEAMAHGLPVVASRTASLPEVGGDAALYVDPQDPRDIADKVRRAVEDRPLRESLIARGLERARQSTWQRVAEQTCAIYDEVLAE
jgi:glycosyltransferase involved in cell wall biosynthesis